MRKIQAQQRRLITVLLAALLSGLSTYGQKPPTNREVKDTTPAPATTLPVGSYYALVIGNNNYRYLGKLETARNDATEVAKLLQKRYGFAPPKLLLDATRDDIFTALTEYRRKLPGNSNLLIYYAGHGYHDRDTDEAYWLPVDAQSDNPDHWISANDITTNIRAIPSKHVLIISDSCYSGVLTRGADVAINPLERDAYLGKMLKSKSRNLMSSGGDEPVADGGGAGHSVFANAILKSLSEMEDEQFTAADLFQRFIKRGVAGRSDQVPQYSFIRNSGDEFGDFVFSRGGIGVVIGSAQDEPSRNYSAFESQLPEIACKREPAAPGLGPKIQQGDIVPCKLLDQPLKWLTPYARPDLPGAQTKWTAMLTVTVDENGRVVDIKPRGGANLQGMDSTVRSAALQWQTNPPLYLGKRVKSSFALDIDFGH